MSDPEKPVEASPNFYGRQSLLRRIFSRIGAQRPQSIAVIGGRKVGKTSLLNYITSPEVIEQFLEQANKYIFLKIGARDNDFPNAQSFLKKVILQLTGTIDPEQNYYNTLQRFVEESHNQNKKIIMLFDDFHFITRNKSYPLEFFSFLRSLANNYNLAYITTSYLELQKLCVVKDIEESPFFNIFTNMSLGILSDGAGQKLFSQLVNKDEQTVKQIVAWCGSAPYILKLITGVVNNRDQIKEEEYERLFLPVIAPYFTTILSILSKEALKPLKDLSNGKMPEPKDAYHLRPLIRHGFLIEEEDELLFFSKAFRIFSQKNLKGGMFKGKESYSN